MSPEDVKTLIRQELPALLQTDQSFRYIVQDMLRDTFADKQRTDDWFEKQLAEMQVMREESERKWNEQQAEIRAMREESERKWNEYKAEMQVMREESERKWNEQQAEIRAMREESERKWNEQHAINQQLLTDNRKFHSTLGAVGSRWGLHSEKSFRDALASILEESFGVQVINVTEWDDEGVVFGQPDQIELDIIIQNGTLIIIEIKSSMSKSDMHTFLRKIAFYENRHHRQANRRIVISPMVDPRATPVAERFGLEVFSYADDVTTD